MLSGIRNIIKRLTKTPEERCFELLKEKQRILKSSKQQNSIKNKIILLKRLIQIEKNIEKLEKKIKGSSEPLVG